MCGINGIISKQPIERSTLNEMIGALRHRGPDAENGFVSDSGTVALGHTRLSIIDLSSQANQPMHSADDRYVVVFNGEIYNFREVRAELERLQPGLKFR